MCFTKPYFRLCRGHHALALIPTVTTPPKCIYCFNCFYRSCSTPMPETPVQCSHCTLLFTPSCLTARSIFENARHAVPMQCRCHFTNIAIFTPFLMQVLSTSTAPDFIAHPLEGKLPTVRKRKAPAEMTSNQKDNTQGKKRRKRGKRTGLLAEEAPLLIGNREEERKLAREQVCADARVVRLRVCRPQKAFIDCRSTAFSR